MHSRLLFYSFLVSGVLFSTDGIAQKKLDRKAVKQLKTDISYLASDALEGRRTGTAGERKAADYIEKRYKEIGIAPYRSQYKLPFHFVYGKEISPNTQIRLANTPIHFPEDGFPLPFSGNKKIHSEVIPEVMEAGNIWMVPLYNDKDEAENPHFEAEKTMYNKAKDAMTNGATGILFYDSYGSKYAPDFNGQSLNETINFPVAFLTFNGYQKYVHNQNNTISLDLDINIKKSERTGTNLAAYIDNHAPYTVILGAHYDHLGYGEDGNSLYAGKDKQIHNGADDNASGTAALLEVSQWIKKHKLHKYNYLFVNFSGEELGLFGSKAFVKDEHVDSAQVAYMINMDMVGRLNDSTHVLEIGGVGTSPAWSEIFAKQDKNFKLIFDSSGVGPSDHTSFYHAGIPVLFFFTGTHKDYHKPSDDADKINYPGEVKVLHYVYHIVDEMENKPKPKYLVTKQTSVGKVNFKVTLGIMPDYTFQDGGVRVDGVSENKPAKRAGIQEGDIIIQLGTYKVQGMQSYMEALAHFNKGDKTFVTVLRDKQKMEIPLEFDK